MSDFINLASLKPGVPPTFKTYHDCPFIEYQTIKKDLIAHKWGEDIVGFIIDCIKLGYYVYTVS